MTKQLKRATSFVLICHGSDCKKAGAKPLTAAAKAHLRALKLQRSCAILKLKCTGACKQAPICGVLPSGHWLERATAEQLIALLPTTPPAKAPETP